MKEDQMFQKGLPPHIFSMLVNELRDVPNIQSKRELIVQALKEFGIYPEHPHANT